MSENVNVLQLNSPAGMQALAGSRYQIDEETGEALVDPRTGSAIITNSRGIHINSALRKDEWEELDRQVVAAAVPPLNIVSRLDQRGLVRRLGSIGTLLAQYNKVSETTPANVSLRGHASGEKNLVDFDLTGVPVPVIFKEFEIDERYLASSRMLGDGVDVANGAAAARVVSEKVEDLTINGDTSVNLNGETIYGITSHPDRNTDTAANYGGGDWGTIDNIVPTIAGMITAAQDAGYYGPYGVWAHTDQYNEAALAFFTDGSGDTPRDRILSFPQVEFFEQSPQLDAGEVVLVTLVADVIQIARVDAFWPITNLEWASGDGMLNEFKALTVFTPMVKSAYGGNSGVVHATGA